MKRNRQNNRTKKETKLVLRRQPAADSMTVALHYVDPNWAVGNNLAGVWSERFVMNSAYDPNPAIGGGSCTYFAEYAALYRRYRVMQFEYAIEFVNQTDASVIASVAPTKEDLGANYAGAIDFGETAYGKSHIVPASGSNNKVTFQGFISLKAFSGHQGYIYDDVTAALCTTSPNQTYYLNISANSYVAQTATSFGVTKRFIYHTMFFDRLSPFA